MLHQLLALLFLVAQQSTLTAAQNQALERVRQSGGDPAWVTENGKEVLCIDYSRQGGKIELSTLEVLTPLYALRIMGPEVDARQYRFLRRLPNFGLLVVTHKGVTDEGMKEIGNLSHLDKLDIRGDSLSRKGLEYLKRLKQLRRLFLYGSKIKDQDVMPLATLTWLDQLELPPTVSIAAIEELKLKLPHTTVTRWDGIH